MNEETRNKTVVASLKAQIANLSWTLAEYEGEIAVLRERIAELEKSDTSKGD